MKWQCLNVVAEMGVSEGLPCCICGERVFGEIFFCANYEDNPAIQHLLSLWVADKRPESVNDPYDKFQVCPTCKDITPWPEELEVE